MLSRMTLAVLLASVWGSVYAQPVRHANYPPQMEGARREIYKRVGDVELTMFVFLPEGQQESHRPAIVFFFGGGWQSGTPAQFYQQCLHLARRGMVAMAADYRVASRHGVKVGECVADAKSAIRWVRREAARLGVDPDRIVAAGGSAGGHLAAATALLPGFDDPADDTQISCRPNALVLFNPALVLAPIEGLPQEGAARLEALGRRLGAPAESLSPYHHIGAAASLPPTLILHGTADTTVPFRTVELFAQAYQKAGGRCQLIGYPNQGHGFFNYGRPNNQYYKVTLEAMETFLADLGYLKAAPPDKSNH